MEKILTFFKAIFYPLPIESHSAHFIPDHTGLMWFIIWSNALIVVSYFLIPLTVIYFVRHRTDIIYNWVFLLVGLFISLCGVTHLMHIVIFWYPLYWLQGIIEAITATASVVAFFVLLDVVPKLAKLTVPKQLEDIRDKLQSELDAHILLEGELERKNQHIEESTRILKEKNTEMMRLNNLMVGREEKIRELEEELKKRKK